MTLFLMLAAMAVGMLVLVGLATGNDVRATKDTGIDVATDDNPVATPEEIVEVVMSDDSTETIITSDDVLSEVNA